MPIKQETSKDPKKMIRYVSAGIAVVMICLAFSVVKMLSSDDSQKRKKNIQSVNLLKPPPPPKVKEKPPEPEVKKKEEIIEQTPEEPEPEQMNEDNADEPPPGNELGLDADGSGGSDGFGLRAKKGGRSIIGGGTGSGTLMRRYAWYTRILEEELRKRLNSHLEKNGGIPDENLKAIVSIKLDDRGKILDVRIAGSCGNKEIDRAMETSFKLAKISEPPPGGMPRTIKLKISVKG